ncbi:MAG TPA: hypothetical protein VMT37_12690 [Solirubrobacterales bacterium]|nr:hypothetical protein [Solirubrobacterales bacterium]
MAEGPKRLRFNFASLQKELEAIVDLAGPFLTAESVRRLQQSKYWLASLKSQPGKRVTWSVPSDEPIRTRESEGEYEAKDGGKGPIVEGALSFVWDMETSPKSVTEVELIGKASTMIRLCEKSGDTHRELSTWKMEIGIGAAESPGCFFHVQMPSQLPVPRLPIFPPTPMVCMEFLLGELFQRDWQRRVDGDGQSMTIWRGVQRDRLGRFFQWQQEQLKGGGSPLMHLKGFPGPDLFVGPSPTV